jgi:hypothetical protein
VKRYDHPIRIQVAKFRKGLFIIFQVHLLFCFNVLSYISEGFWSSKHPSRITSLSSLRLDNFLPFTLNKDSWLGSNTPETSQPRFSMVNIKVCFWVNGDMGIYRYKGGYVTVTVSVVTIEFGCYIASICVAHLLFRKLLIRLFPYSFDNVARVSLSEIFHCDDKFERILRSCDRAS